MKRNLTFGFRKVGRCRLLLLCLSLITAMCIHAQSSRVVEGIIKDALGEPLIGVNVTVQNDATLGTISDINGKYSLQLPQKEVTLVFSFIGYKTVEQKVGVGQNRVDLQMEEDMIRELSQSPAEIKEEINKVEERIACLKEELAWTKEQLQQLKNMEQL